MGTTAYDLEQWSKADYVFEKYVEDRYNGKNSTGVKNTVSKRREKADRLYYGKIPIPNTKPLTSYERNELMRKLVNKSLIADYDAIRCAYLLLREYSIIKPEQRKILTTGNIISLAKEYYAKYYAIDDPDFTRPIVGFRAKTTPTYVVDYSTYQEKFIGSFLQVWLFFNPEG
jgi:hypothetical protein